jgi:protein-S-isoprenylcysteine O-methyltransferase Ste14
MVGAANCGGVALMASRAKSWAVSAAFTLFGGPGILGVLLPFWIGGWRLPRPLTLMQWAGTAIIVLGAVPLLESIVRFVRVGRGTLAPMVPTEQLVVSGLYKFVRNPMYVGVVTAVFGQALLFRNRSVGIYAGILWAGFTAFILLYEEPTLKNKYGAAYRLYCGHVGRWLPRLKRCKAGASG